jgi:hypothetical protein
LHLLSFNSAEQFGQNRSGCTCSRAVSSAFNSSGWFSACPCPVPLIDRNIPSRASWHKWKTTFLISGFYRIRRILPTANLLFSFFVLFEVFQPVGGYFSPAGMPVVGEKLALLWTLKSKET